MGSWKGRGNQYIQLVKVLYCKLPTNDKQLPAFPLEVEPSTELRPQKWEVRVLPLCHRDLFRHVEDEIQQYETNNMRLRPFRAIGGLFQVKSDSNITISLIKLIGNQSKNLAIMLHWSVRSYLHGRILVDRGSPVVEVVGVMPVAISKLPRITHNK